MEVRPFFVIIFLCRMTLGEMSAQLTEGHFSHNRIPLGEMPCWGRGVFKDYLALPAKFFH
jgi:hypothetical protein